MTTNYPYQDPYPTPQPPPAPPAPQPRPGRRLRMLAGGVAALTAAAVVGGFAVAGHGPTVSGHGSSALLLPTIPGDMNRGSHGHSTSVGLATAAQQKGVVTIVSVL